jgi:hypothetical protein
VGARSTMPGLGRRGSLALAIGVALLTASCSASSPASGGSAARRSGSSSAGDSASSPAGGSGGSSAGGRSQSAYSACMASDGVPGVPTSLPSVLPTAPSRNGPHWSGGSVSGPDPGSPQFDAAQHACQSLMPPPARVP